MYTGKYIRPQDNIEYTITQRAPLSLMHDDMTQGTNDFIGFMVKGGGKTYIPVAVAIVPALPFVWGLVVNEKGTNKQEVEDKLLKLFVLQIKKIIKKNPEELNKYFFTFKTDRRLNDQGKEEMITNFPEYDNSYEKTIENFEKDIEK